MFSCRPRDGIGDWVWRGGGGSEERREWEKSLVDLPVFLALKMWCFPMECIGGWNELGKEGEERSL